MALILKDRVKVTTTTTGTGALTLGAAVAGFQDFSVIGDGNTTYYTINDAAGGDWEVGIGTYSSTGGTLSRDLVLESSNSGNLVNFGAGDKVVFVTYPAEKSSVSFRTTVTANYTAGPSEGVIADTTGGAFTVTMPASPIAGTQVVISDGGGAFGANNLTVGRNGSTIVGLAEDLVLDIDSVSVQFVYDGTTWQVYAQIGAAGGTAVTLDDVQTLTNKTIVTPELTGAPYVNGSYRGNIIAIAALDIDCSAGNYFTKTINTSSTFTFSNPPASRSFAFTLELTHTSGAVTWPVSVEWPGGTAPILTDAKTSLFVFVTDDGGARWRGAALVDYVT